MQEHTPMGEMEGGMLHAGGEGLLQKTERFRRLTGIGPDQGQHVQHMRIGGRDREHLPAQSLRFGEAALAEQGDGALEIGTGGLAFGSGVLQETYSVDWGMTGIFHTINYENQ
jgi:hypothetical protein